MTEEEFQAWLAAQGTGGQGNVEPPELPPAYRPSGETPTWVPDVDRGYGEAPPTGQQGPGYVPSANAVAAARQQQRIFDNDNQRAILQAQIDAADNDAIKDMYAKEVSRLDKDSADAAKQYAALTNGKPPARGRRVKAQVGDEVGVMDLDNGTFTAVGPAPGRRPTGGPRGANPITIALNQQREDFREGALFDFQQRQFDERMAQREKLAELAREQALALQEGRLSAQAAQREQALHNTFEKMLAQQAWEKARAQMEQEGAMARQQLSSGVNLAEMLQGGFFKALPYAAIPGQQYFLGAEPGGVNENIARLSGRVYNPETFRAPIQQYNPGDAWAMARKAMGM